MAKTEHSLALFDPHPVVLHGLRAALAGHGKYSIVGEATSTRDLLNMVAQMRPGIVVADLDVSDEASRRVIQKLQEPPDPARVVLFLSRNSGAVVLNALRNLVAGLLFKECPPAELIDCLDTVACGRHYYTPRASDCLVDQFARGRAWSENSPSLHQLTNMERRILAQVAADKSSEQIAAALFISPHTVSTHRKNIAAKLNVRGKHGLLRFAMDHREHLLDWNDELRPLPDPSSFKTNPARLLGRE